MRIDPESGEDALNLIDRVGSLLWQIDISGQKAPTMQTLCMLPLWLAGSIMLILLNGSNCPTAPWISNNNGGHYDSRARRRSCDSRLQTQQLNHKLQNMLTCSQWLATQRKHEDF
eukprot:s1533_g9.t1